MKGALDPRAFLEGLFHTACAAADPMQVLPRHLPAPPKGRTIVVGAGKAASRMALAVEAHWPGPLGGLVVTRHGQRLPLDRIEIVESAHPVPDQHAVEGAERVLAAVQGLTPDDLVLCLISGGGSALMTLPADGLSLDDKQAVTRALLKSGATIGEMNTVRKHLSRIKGGRLAAAAAPAQVLTLAISDVPGDDPAIIASGPTVADPTTFLHARHVIERYGIALPPAVARHFERAEDESPKPGDPRLASNRFTMIATPQMALEAAAAAVKKAQRNAVILGDALEGEAREVAKVHAAIAKSIAHHGHPAQPPAVLLSGGETTVTVRGQGRGGRNAEFMLALAIALEDHPGIFAIAGDTDGIDGTEDNAGAIIDPTTLSRARAIGLDPQAMLDNNDAYGFFKALGDLVVTGPTYTNVNDFRAILIH
ncbi:hydroxypyruvate reductase [Aliidongia dinghuensis]|uniref:Hydroxypyruvate reductase n=1 Tax=Aliidongia dinghuensis TaxID=1867774 RepID=A0A8J3E2S1_9PROT|nr:glycerate kinase [Aliidongia dinghuensis]GGF23825.1 hydroxypyruvate reductase [Aliidongia dinghuensis]